MERAYVFKSKSAVVPSTQLLQGHSGGRTGDFPRGERATGPRVKWYSGGPTAAEIVAMETGRSGLAGMRR